MANGKESDRGFAGLSSLVSDIADHGKTVTAASRTERPASTAGTGKSGPDRRSSPAGERSAAAPTVLQLTPNMPDVTAGSPSRVFLAGDSYTLLLVQGVTPIGERQGVNPLGLRYPFALAAVHTATKAPVCFVTLESNALGSTFLCLFPRRGGHVNLGEGDAYAAEAAFLDKALELAKTELGVATLQEIRPPRKTGAAAAGSQHRTDGASDTVRGNAGTRSESGSEAGKGTSAGSETSSGGGKAWALAFAGLVFVGVLIMNSEPQRAPTPPASPPTVAAARSTPGSGSSSTSPGSTTSPAPTAVDEPAYAMPPIGTNAVLSKEQIRWCLRQEIRIEAQRSLATAGTALTIFNKAVEDYNGRCTSFRYRSGALERAREDVAAVRAQIVAQARAEVTGRMGSARSTPPPSAVLGSPGSGLGEKAARESWTPDRETVRAAQTILSDLGYDPGVVDGVAGRRTREAIRAFQRDRGFPVDGEISRELLERLAVANIGLRHGSW